MTDKPVITPADVALLETILAEFGDWMLAKHVAVSWRWQEKYPQGDRTRATWLVAQERKIRAIASGSAGSIISFPGSKGYKLRVLASSDEIQTAIAKLKHQGIEMMARATAIECWSPLPVTAHQTTLRLCASVAKTQKEQPCPS